MIRVPEDGDVIEFDGLIVNGQPLMKFSRVKNCLRGILRGEIKPELIFDTTFSKGFNCKVMTIDRIGWRKAKLVLKLHFEFEDEPEP
ncbi:MAG: hypothetical protein WBA07_09820 [Rivularia sp. (in: cyanobacteria)]